MSKVTSFKTHDPFVVLDHLEGALPAHCSSLILCSLLYFRTWSDTYQRNGFEGTVINMIFVHVSCIVLQFIMRYFKRKEAQIVIQESNKKKSQKDSQAYPPVSQGSEITAKESDRLEELFKFKLLKKFRLLKISLKMGGKVWSIFQERVSNVKQQVHQVIFQKDKEQTQVSTLHFFGMSLCSVLSTCVYLYFIFDLITKLFFREHPLLELYGIERGEEDGDPTRERKLLSEIDPSLPPVPPIYFFSNQKQLQTIGSPEGCCELNREAEYIQMVNGTAIPCPNLEIKCKYQNAAFYMTEEAAIFSILIFDFVSQILAILCICMAQFVVDIEQESMTDRMNELRYQMKILLVIFNTTISNTITTYYIEFKEQFVNTNITSITNNLDTILLVLFIVFLGYAIWLKYRKGRVQTIAQVMKKSFGKLLAATMISLQMTKFVLFFFGNLYFIAKFQYLQLPLECTLAYMLMKYQFLLFVFFIFDLLHLIKMGEDEAEMINVLKKNDERQDCMDQIKNKFRQEPSQVQSTQDAKTPSQSGKTKDEYEIENNHEEINLINKIFDSKNDIQSLKNKNVIISDVRIDENEYTFDDFAARVLNFNKKQEVQRVHDVDVHYGDSEHEIKLFNEDPSSSDPDEKEAFDEKNAFVGNPLAECIWLELDQRIIYQKVRLYLEKKGEQDVQICFNYQKDEEDKEDKEPKKNWRASTVLGVISKIRQLYINRNKEKLEMILNITDGNPMCYKKHQNKVGENVIMVRRYNYKEEKDHEEKSKTKKIPAVTIDITDWVKQGDQETIKKNPKLIKLLQIKQHFKVFMGCAFQSYSKLALEEKDLPDENDKDDSGAAKTKKKFITQRKPDLNLINPKEFLQKFKITFEELQEIRKEERDKAEDKDEYNSLYVKMREIEFYFEEHQNDKNFEGAENYYLTTRLQEVISDYVTQMQSQIKQRHAMMRIEKCVEELLKLLREPEMDNFMILRQCKWIDTDMNMLRHEPTLFDDTDEYNVFPMILSSNCMVRLYQLKNRKPKSREKLTLTEVYDAILQIDFQNEFTTKNGPQDLLKSKLEQVQEEARECIVQITQNQQNQEYLEKDEDKHIKICSENFEELNYEENWLKALNDENVTPNAKCQDCNRTVEQAYGKIEKDDKGKYDKGKQEQIINALGYKSKIPYPFIFFSDDLKEKGKFCCADCGVERRAEVELERFLQLEESTYCFSFVSMMTGMESNLTTIQGLYFKAQTVFFIQILICIFLIYKNLLSETERLDFIEADPFTLLMRLLTAYLFHIQTLEDAQSAYRRILFLTRYPDRFEPKMRFPALLLCFQQFIVNLVAEVMNMMILCQLPDFNELIMNYVTFAEILNLDNLYISTQLKYNGDLKEVIEDPSQKEWLRRFKNEKFHRNDQASNLTKFTENLVRIIYKLIYFYLLPLLVIPVGYSGYMRDLKNVKEEEGFEDYSWDKYLKSQSKYPIQDEVDGDYIRQTNFNFLENDSMQLYMFTVLTITGLGLRIGQLYLLKNMSWDKIMLTNPFFSKSRFIQFILSVPFLVMIAFKFLLFLKDHFLSRLLLVGLYFKFLPDENDKYQNCQLSDLESHDCDFLQWANLYFYFFLIFNLIDTDFQRASFVDYSHFVFKTLGQPVLVYKIFNDLLYSITLEPWLDPDNSNDFAQEPPRRGAYEIRVKQILFLLCFSFIKMYFYDKEQKCYDDEEIEVKEENSEGEDQTTVKKQPKSQARKRNLFMIITFFQAFASFIFCQIVGDVSFAVKDKMDKAEPSEFSKQSKEMLFGVWRAKVDTWMQYMQFDKAGAYIEVYAFLFLLFCIYQFASGWYIKYKIENEKLDEEEIMKDSIQKQILKLRERKLLDAQKKQDLSKSRLVKIKSDSSKKIFRVKAFLFFLVPFQTYFFINFGLSAWYKFVLQYGLSQTLKTNGEVVKQLNPIVFFMSAFSAPYFFMSLLLQQILKVVQFLLDHCVIPPWDEFRLSAHNSEFRWYKFLIYYQIYFSLLVVYLAYVRWNVYQLRQVRYKSNPRGKENGHLLHKISKNPYTLDFLKEYEEEHPDEAPPNSNQENPASSNEPETVLVSCSNCKRVIPDGEVFKHCSVFTEDYCQNCWIVDPDQVKQYLEGSTVLGDSNETSKSILSQTVEIRVKKSKRFNEFQNWFTGHNIELGEEGTFLRKLGKYIYILTIPGTPALMYVLINILLYYLSYWLILGLICLYKLNARVSQVLIGLGFLALAAYIGKQILDLPDDGEDQDSDDENENDLGKSEGRQSNQVPLLDESVDQAEGGEEGKDDENSQSKNLSLRSTYQTISDKLAILAPQSQSVLFVLLAVTLAMAVSQFVLFANANGRLAQKIKLDFYTYLAITVVAAFIWEHSIPERFDQKVAVIISIIGILFIGQHILNQIVIQYTWHVLELAPPDTPGLDIANVDENDYCCWMRGVNCGQDCPTI